jgi:hypothetical protein
MSLDARGSDTPLPKNVRNFLANHCAGSYVRLGEIKQYISGQINPGGLRSLDDAHFGLRQCD